MIKRQMRVMDFITRERVYRFLEEYSKSTSAKFLHPYFPKKVIDSLLASFEVRIDTRCCYKGDYAAILVFKSKNGKIRDVRMILFNPDTGMIVRDGDGDALIQHTKKQNSQNGMSMNVNYLLPLVGLCNTGTMNALNIKYQ